MESLQVHRNWCDLVADKFRFAAKTSKAVRKISVAATFGSCFANEVRNSLSELGFSTLPSLTQDFAAFVSPRSFEIPSWGCYDERIHLQYYNPGSLAQELLRSINEFVEGDDEFWVSRDAQGGELWADPYKRFLYGDSHGALLKARSILNSQITHALRTADTVILTLGLTEAFCTEWKKFACLPPLIPDRRAQRSSTFHFLDFNASYTLMRNAIGKFLSAFPTKQILITTSPIPLDRTFRGIDIAVANCESKSILRAVCGQLERDFESVIYFPSYELVLTDENSWEKDARHVSPSKVREIMTNFIENTLGLDAGDNESRDPKFNLYTSHWAALRQSFSENLGTLDPASCRENFNLILQKMDKDKNAGQNVAAIPPAAFCLWDNGKLAQVKERTLDSLALVQGIFRHKKLDFIKTHAADAQVVIELGAGPGLNLFELAISHPELHRFQLHAFEYTRAGRELTHYLSGRFGISVQTHPFDFNNPTSLSSKLQEITGDRPTVILTSYAIEQIPLVQSEVIHALLSIKNLLRVIHVEPVGWQTDDKLSDFDADFKRECIRLNYNENLVPLLRSCQDSALISNLQVVKHAVSHRVTLPGTFVTWEPNRGSAAPASTTVASS
jgi:hypothetical protein